MVGLLRHEHSSWLIDDGRGQVTAVSPLTRWAVADPDLTVRENANFLKPQPISVISTMEEVHFL